MTDKIKMMVSTSNKPLTLVNSGVKDSNGKALVLIANYTKDGKYGYFICNETIDNSKDPVQYIYSNPISFYENTGKDVYQKAVAEYSDIVVLYVRK